jgi:hypothetical protein
MSDTFAHFANNIEGDWIEDFLSEQSEDDSDLYDDATMPDFAHDVRGDWS